MKHVTVGTHRQCVELVSGKFRLAVTTKVGPRVISGTLGEGANLFAVLPPKPYADETGWCLYGGHRLWHAPEEMPRTYAPDSAPVEVFAGKGGAYTFANGPEPLTGIAKSITIRPLKAERFEVTHTLINTNLWPVELAPWALSVMAPGGRAIIPQHHATVPNNYAVDRSLHLWPYSKFNDPRLHLGADFFVLDQDVKASGPCKIGCNAEAGWVAYVNHGQALVKFIEWDPTATYADHGCNVESYSCADFCEIETLGPLVRLAPGATTTHVETWLGLSKVGPITDEASIKEHLVRRLR